MRRIVSLATSFIVLFSFCACGKQMPTWQEQYDLGTRYLSEGNYQEAIIAFTAAIEIDSMRPEAYLKAAEAYEAVGDSEAARAILEQGYSTTGDESLRPQRSTSEERLGEGESASVTDDSDIPSTPDILGLLPEAYTPISSDLEEYLEDIIHAGAGGDYYAANELIVEKTQGIIEYGLSITQFEFWGLLSDESLVVCDYYTREDNTWYISKLEYRPVLGKGFLYRGIGDPSDWRFYYGDMTDRLWNGEFQGFAEMGDLQSRTYHGRAVNDLIDGEYVTYLDNHDDYASEDITRHQNFSNGVDLGWPEGDRTESGGAPSIKDVYENGNVFYWGDLYDHLISVGQIG